MKIIHFLIGILILTSCSNKSKDHDSGWYELTESADSSPTEIEIFGEQFKWTVRYSGKDNTLGKFDYKLINEANPLGLLTSQSIEYTLAEMESRVSEINGLISESNEFSDKFSSKELCEMKSELSRKEKFVRLLNQMKTKHDIEIDKSAIDDIILTDTLVLCVDEEYDFNFASGKVPILKQGKMDKNKEIIPSKPCVFLFLHFFFSLL